jgi:hypothetical protein
VKETCETCKTVIIQFPYIKLMVTTVDKTGPLKIIDLRKGPPPKLRRCDDRDKQAQTSLIITINDTSIGDLPLIITISDTCKNQSKSLDFDNVINLSRLIVNLPQ